MAATYVLHGTVTDLAGAPVIGATVALSDGTEDHVATTDTLGQFTRPITFSAWRVRISHAGHATLDSPVDAIETNGKQGWRLAPAASIRGIVIARSGEPIADAEVTATGGIRQTHASARTGSDGSFELEHLGPGALSLAVSSPRAVSYRPAQIGLAMGEQLTGVRITADRAYRIRGTLRDARGTVSGVEVDAYGGRGRAWRGSPPTTGNGAFEITGLPPGTYELGASDGARHVAGQPSFVVVDDDLQVELVMIDGDPDQSLGQAKRALMTVGERGISGGDERFALRHFPDGRFRLRALRDDGSIGVATRELHVKPVADGALAARAGAQVSGTVSDAAGRPVPYAHVRVRHFAGRDVDAFTETVADGDGHFRIGGLDAGRTGLTATDREHRGTRSGELVVDLAEAEHRQRVALIVAASELRISGQVVDASGLPVAGAWVQLWPGEALPSDAEGRFELSDIAAGTYHLWASGPRGEATTWMKVVAGAHVKIQLVQLGSILGRVTSRGEPVRRFVVAYGDDSDTQQVVDAIDGAFVFERVPAGEYRVFARCEHGLGASRIVVEDRPVAVELAVSTGATVTGVAIDLHGRPLGGLAVTLAVPRHFADAVPTAMTDELGRFTLERAPLVGVIGFRSPGLQYGSHSPYEAVERAYLDLGPLVLPPSRTGAKGDLGFEVSFKEAGVVSEIVPGGPAALAGLAPGDRLVAFDGVPLAPFSAAFVFRLLWTASVGQTVRLGLARGITIEITARR